MLDQKYMPYLKVEAQQDGTQRITFQATLPNFEKGFRVLTMIIDMMAIELADNVSPEICEDAQP